MQDTDRQTEIQKNSVKQLLRKGFRINTEFREQDGTVEIMMSRKVRGSTLYADVNSQGLVNGNTVQDYIINLCGLNS